MKHLPTLVVCAALALLSAYAAAQNAMMPRPQGAMAPVASADADQAAKALVDLVSGSMLSEIANKTTAQVWPPIETALRNQNSKIDAAMLAQLRSDHTVYVGVMAQEVQTIVPSAVSRGRDGYLRVDYDRLGLQFMTWDQWLEWIQRP